MAKMKLSKSPVVFLFLGFVCVGQAACADEVASKSAFSSKHGSQIGFSEPDRDHDGVPDNKDRCPDSLSHAVVGVDGCLIPPVDFLVGDSIKLLFDHGVSAVVQPQIGEIGKIAVVLRAYPEAYMDLQGHTDSAENTDLSLARANAVRDILIYQYGVNGAHITVVGLGASDPIGDDRTPGGQAINRRVIGVLSGAPAVH